MTGTNELQQAYRLVQEYYNIAATVDVMVETERQVEILNELQPMFDKFNVSGVGDLEDKLIPLLTQIG